MRCWSPAATELDDRGASCGAIVGSAGLAESAGDDGSWDWVAGKMSTMSPTRNNARHETESSTTMPKTTKPPTYKTGHTAVAHYASRLDSLDQRSLARWAARCAEHVLPYFEREHPTDDRPRRAIEAARAWARGEIRCGAARAAAVAAHAAARTCTQPAATAAARATGHAAATAHMPVHARGAAAYAITATAAAAPDPRENAINAERQWQIQQLPPAT